MRTRHLAFILAATLVVGAALPDVGHAEPTKAQQDEAKTRFLKGVKLYGEGDFRASLVEFKRSYELNPNFNVLYNIGQVHYQLKDYASALTTLNQYLSVGGARVTASRRDEVQTDIQELTGRVASIKIKVNEPGAQILVDDEAVGQSPLAGAIAVNAGKRKFSAAKEGFQDARETREVVGAEAVTIELTLTPRQSGGDVSPMPTGSSTSDPPPPLPPEEKRGPSYVGPFISLGLTGATMIVWGVTGGLALSADGDLAEMKKTVTPEAELDDAASKASTLAAVSDVMLGLSIAGAAVTTTLFIVVATSDSGAEPEVALGVSPTGVTLGGRF